MTYYCHRCRAKREVNEQSRCKECKQPVWEALANIPGTDSPKLRTTSETYKKLLKPNEENV